VRCGVCETSNSDLNTTITHDCAAENFFYLLALLESSASNYFQSRRLTKNQTSVNRPTFIFSQQALLLSDV
jgi:hypothetical protein